MFGIGLAPNRDALPATKSKLIGQPITWDTTHATFDSTRITMDNTVYTRPMFFPNEVAAP